MNKREFYTICTGMDRDTLESVIANPSDRVTPMMVAIAKLVIRNSAHAPNYKW